MIIHVVEPGDSLYTNRAGIRRFSVSSLQLTTD